MINHSRTEALRLAVDVMDDETHTPKDIVACAEAFRVFLEGDTDE